MSRGLDDRVTPAIDGFIESAMASHVVMGPDADPEESLREARTHFALMRRHAQGDLADRLVIDAICMRMSAGAETLARLHRDPGSAVRLRIATCSSTRTSRRSWPASRPSWLTPAGTPRTRTTAHAHPGPETN